MKLDYIYLSVGITTVMLNLAVTLHFMTRHRRTENIVSSTHEETVTFRLSGGGKSTVGSRERKVCDETETLQ